MLRCVHLSQYIYYVIIHAVQRYNDDDNVINNDVYVYLVYDI